MKRRSFLGLMAAAFALDPERLLYAPGKKIISIPRPIGLSIRFMRGMDFERGMMISRIDLTTGTDFVRSIPDGIEGSVVQSSSLSMGLRAIEKMHPDIDPSAFVAVGHGLGLYLPLTPHQLISVNF